MGLFKFFSLMAIVIASFSGESSATSSPTESSKILREEAQSHLQSRKSSLKAAHAYVHLLKTVDDEKSGEDMLRLIEACRPIEKTLPPEEVLDITLMPNLPEEDIRGSEKPAPADPPFSEVVVKKPFIDLNALIDTYMPLHKDNPYFIMSVADYFYRQAPHFIARQGGVSFRTLTGRGNNIRCDKADRKKALVMYNNLLNKHLNDSELKKDKAVLSKIMEGFITVLLNRSSFTWNSYAHLLRKTDIDTDTPPDEKSTFSSIEDIPVDKQGRIILFSLPESWEAAKSDIERIFFLYEQALSLASGNQSQKLRLGRAKIGSALFSLSNLMAFEDRDNSIIPAALRQTPKLADNQSIIYSKGKPHVITIPPYLDYIRELKSIAKLPGDNQTKYDICIELACTLIARNRLSEALDYINQADQYADDKYKKKRLTKTRDQILKPSLMFIPRSCSWIPEANGKPLSFDILYRNAQSVKISLKRINVDAIAQDYPKKNDSGTIDIERCVLADIMIHSTKPSYPRSQYAAKYILGEPITSTQQISSTPDHIDKLAALPLPAADPGIYLLELTPEDGNPICLMINISKLTLFMRDCPQGIMWIAADAETGIPIKGAKLQGWMIQGDKNIYISSEINATIIPFTGETNAEGIFIIPISKENRTRIRAASCLATHQKSIAPWNWIGEGQHFGLQKLFDGKEKPRSEFIFLTSQPVYKPGQTVLAQCRMISGNYKKASLTTLGDKEWSIRISDPTEKPIDIGKQTVKTDATGAFPFEYTLPPQANPGDYRVSIWEKGTPPQEAYNAVFRVKEFKKSEFNVSLTPQSHIIRLGDEIQFTIRANSLAGPPVAGGKAVVNITQSPLLSAYKPSWKWNWLATLAYRAPCRPFPPTRILSDHHVTLDNQGGAIITLPTSQNKNDFEKMAQEYKIDVSVTDSSLQEISASSSILATVLPFEAFAEMESNYARQGEPIPVSLFAKTILGNPVPGVTGTASLSRLTLDQGNIVETELSSASVLLDQEGNGSLVTKADQPGSYKLTLALKNDKGENVSISKEFLAYGKSASKDTPPFPSTELKLTPEKKAYAPGETVRVLITSSNKKAFIWAFSRSGWDNEQVQTLTLKNQSGILDVETSQRDMPNFGISALTISHGILFHEKTSILLPPEKKCLKVQVASNKSNYRPDQEGTLAVQIKTDDDKPAPANTQITIAIYNKDLKRFARNTRPFSQKVWSRTNPEPISIAAIGNNECYGIEVLVDYMDMSRISGLSTFIPSLYVWVQLEYRSRNGPSYSKWLWSIVSANLRLNGRKQLPNSFRRFESDPYPDRRASSPTPCLTSHANAVDNIKWCGSLVTDEKGQVHVPFKTSGDLTTWQVKVWAISPDLSVGETTAEFICSKES